MAKEKEKQPPRKRRVRILRVILQYMFILWPSMRNYVMLWFQYKPDNKKKEKEKIVIIKDS